jgi:hypothetical protein
MAATSASRRRLVGIVLAIAAALIATGLLAGDASGHAGGAWMFQWEVQDRMANRGYNLPMCTGKGAYRYPPNAPPDRNRFLYRHFQCLVTDERGFPVAVRCVHSLARKRLSVGIARPPDFTCRF